MENEELTADKDPEPSPEPAEYVGAGFEPEYGIPEAARAEVAQVEMASRAPTDFEMDYVPSPFLANGQTAAIAALESELVEARLRRTSGIFVNDHVLDRDRRLLNGDR